MVFSTSDSPTTKEDCKNGGYAKYGFKNQGQCKKAVVVEPPPPADTTPPEITLSGPEGTTEDATPTYTYSANEPVTFKCLYEFTPAGASSPNQSGSDTPCPSPKTWTLSPGDGKWVFTFEATDTAGNKATASKTLILDREPETRILAGPEGDYSNVVETDPQTGQQYHDVTFEITVQGESSATFECRLTPSGGSLSSDWTPCGNIPSGPFFAIERIPGDGETRTFEVRAIDPGGRVDQTPASRSFTLPDSSP